ncbi:unannotated protein [freshwater metagenome]|uniref:Unannotated protein n=1 Tax=freshwater metagenome TaxID=449393 RepID=A0A6J7EVD4_9ZZZZ
MLDVDLEVILQVLADARQVMDGFDPDRPQVLGVADAGELQELWGVEGAAAQDHLAGGDARGAPALLHDVHADGAIAVHHDGRDLRSRAHREVPAVHDRVQVRAGGRQSAAPTQIAVERGEPLLLISVDIAGYRVSGLLDGFEECAEERVAHRASLEFERPAAAAVLICPGEAVLHAFEVRQAVRVVPVAHARVGRPPLEVQGIAPLEDHAVDAARSAEQLAPAVSDPAIEHVRLGLG